MNIHKELQGKFSSYSFNKSKDLASYNEGSGKK